VDATRREGGRDELDLFGVITLLWKKRWHILAGGFAGALIGLTVGLLAKPVYYSEAVLSPKSAKGSGTTSSLAQIGGLGGIVAAQLGAGNAPLDRLQLLVTSRDLAVSVIQRGNLLPRLYPDSWNAERKAWKPGRQPSLKEAAVLLRSSLKVSAEPKLNALTLGIQTYDSTLAKDLVEHYISALEKNIQESVRADADSNRSYLEGQMAITGDPQLQAKILLLIAGEVEKGMLVNSRSFDIIDSPLVPSFPKWPKKKLILIISFFLGLLVTVLATIAVRGYQEFRRYQDSRG
jgi:uncharacterized protein involved in exopolysaccharide biosynthesis